MESGRDALSVIAEENGMWNWCFIGPDAKELPVVKGGRGSVPEMQDCLASHTDHAVLFGLLRVSFGMGKMKRNKFVFIVASNEEGSAVKSAVVTGRAMSERGAIEKEIAGYVHISLSLEVKRASDLTIEHVVENLSSKVIVDGAHNRAKEGEAGAVFNAAEVTKAMEEEEAAKEAFAAAQVDSPTMSEAGDVRDPGEDLDLLEHDEEFQKEIQQMEQQFVEGARAPAGLDSEVAAAAAAAKAEEEADAAAPAAAAAAAEVEAAEKPWAEDQCQQLDGGRPDDDQRFAQKDLLLDKYTYDTVAKAVEGLNACAVRAPKGYCVIMTKDEKFFFIWARGPEDEPLFLKCVGLAAVEDCRKPAIPQGPQIPEEPVELQGLILKQATNFFAEWQLRAFHISRGKIAYWPDLASKAAGYRAKAEYSMLNATVALIKSSDSRFQLTLKSTKALERAPYLLMANISAVATPEEAKYRHTRDSWVRALVQHATYAKKDLAYRRAAALVGAK